MLGLTLNRGQVLRIGDTLIKVVWTRSGDANMVICADQSLRVDRFDPNGRRVNGADKGEIDPSVVEFCRRTQVSRPME